MMRDVACVQKLSAKEELSNLVLDFNLILRRGSFYNRYSVRGGIP